MVLNPYDPLGMTKDQLDQMLKPFRDQHEVMLRALAPMMGTGDLFRDLTKSMAALSPSAMGSYEKGYAELTKAFSAIGKPQLQDFSSLLGMSGSTGREIASIRDVVETQSRWMEEALRLTKVDIGLTGTLASIEKLTASQRLLLQDDVWDSPRPFAHSLTDILVLGRASWATSEVQQARGTADEQRRAEALVKRSAAAIEELASVEDSSLETISAEEAEEHVELVSSLLVVEAEVVSPAHAIVGDPVLTGGMTLLVTISEVIRLVETRNGKALAGGFAGWILKSALELLDPARAAEDRFDSLVEFLYNFFVDGVNYTDQSLLKVRPAFFTDVIQDLRNKHVSHAPEAATKTTRIAANLTRREQRLKDLGNGRVPVTPAEWNAALLVLLGRAALAAVEFRDRL